MIATALFAQAKKNIVQTKEEDDPVDFADLLVDTFFKPREQNKRALVKVENMSIEDVMGIPMHFDEKELTLGDIIKAGMKACRPVDPEDPNLSELSYLAVAGNILHAVHHAGYIRFKEVENDKPNES